MAVRPQPGTELNVSIFSPPPPHSPKDGICHNAETGPAPVKRLGLIFIRACGFLQISHQSLLFSPPDHPQYNPSVVPGCSFEGEAN